MVLRQIRGRIEQFFEKHPKTTQVVGKSLHPSNLIRLASAPLMAGGVAARGIASRAGGAIRTAFKRATTNPFAGLSFKQAVRKGAGSALSVGGLVVGTEAIRAGITGQEFSPFSRRGALTAIGVGFGGIPSLVAGSSIGLTQLGFQKGKKAVEQIQEIGFPNIPSIPQPTFFDFGALSGMQPSIPSFPNAPSFGGGGVFSPSVSVSPSGSVGGGGLDPALLALLIGGAGALGFGLGRRRRKKKTKRKKYKGGRRKR